MIYRILTTNGELYHHGIRGQKWGKRNGPPYPLSGGDYSPEEKKYFKKSKVDDIHNKKHFDKKLSIGGELHTLSFDKNRTSNTDMFYATYTNKDFHQYNTLFNKKAPIEQFDEQGNSLGTSMMYKFNISNKVTKDLKIASEDSGADAFVKLYHNNRDFYNFVTDPDRMQKLFVEDKYKFKGYREAKESLERMRNSERPSEKDLRTAYRMFNYVIPNQDKDTTIQRAKMFNELKSKGYGAMLDTNDAIYGAFKADAPVIVFDMSTIVNSGSNQITIGSKAFSEFAFIGRKALLNI